MYNNPEGNRLSNLLRDRREELGMSLNELARQAGLDPAGLFRIEKSDRLPSPDKLAALAVTLGLPLADLYEAAGYPLTEQLPSIRPYLCRAYGVPEKAVDEIEAYLQRIAYRYGAMQENPAHGEDEDK